MNQSDDDESFNDDDYSDDASSSDYIDVIDNKYNEHCISCGSATFLIICALSTVVCLMWH